MKLIHCADLHLDSPMEANLTGERARERGREIRDTFLRMIRYAVQLGVTVILIAGDLFDSSRVRESTRRLFLDAVANHPGISFFYLAGNHDRGVRFEDGERPKNLFCFGDGWRTYDLGEVTVTGSEQPNEETLTLDRARCNIVLLHGQDRAGAGRRETDVIRMGLLRGRGIDYLALGHLHSQREIPLDARGVAVYSGCLEGRGFDECGDCGFVLLETEGQRLRRKFIPFARRRIYCVSADITGAESHYAIEERVRGAIEGIEEGALVRVILTGRRGSAQLIDTEGLVSFLEEHFYFGDVRDGTVLGIRAEDYAHDPSLRGAFVRGVLASELSDAAKERVIACGLRALAGEETGI